MASKLVYLWCLAAAVVRAKVEDDVVQFPHGKAFSLDEHSTLEVLIRSPCHHSDKMEQYMAVIQSHIVHSQFLIELNCGEEQPWRMQLPPRSGRYLLSIYRNFYNFSLEAVTNDFVNEEEDHVLLVHSYGARYEGKVVCRTYIEVEGTRQLPSAESLDGSAFEHLPGYWLAVPEQWREEFQGRGEFVYVNDVAELGLSVELQAGHYLFLGDSILRQLFPFLCDVIGAELQGDKFCHTCCNDQGVCLGRTMWLDDGHVSNVTELPMGSCLPKELPKAVYLSIGSHSIYTSATPHHIARYRSIFDSVVSVYQPKMLLAMSTSAMQELTTPLSYHDQFFVFSNMRIERINKMIKDTCSHYEQCLYFDLFSPTLALRDYPGGYHIGDSIHYMMGHESIAKLVIQSIAANMLAT